MCQLHLNPMRLCHPPDGSTSPKYKLLCFITAKKNFKEKNALAFNWDRWCHLVLCLQLIPFHCLKPCLNVSNFIFYITCSKYGTKYRSLVSKQIYVLCSLNLPEWGHVTQAGHGLFTDKVHIRAKSHPISLQNHQHNFFVFNGTISLPDSDLP